jgi:secretion/DNA translocation related TadE-like protein
LNRPVAPPVERRAPVGPDEARSTTSPRARECGSATVWVVSLLSVLLLVGGAALVLAGALVQHARAVTAADLAALAAASVIQSPASGAGPPCAVAAAVAASNGGRLATCTVTGEVVDVSVTVAFRAPVAARATATASARAGPIS